MISARLYRRAAEGTRDGYELGADVGGLVVVLRGHQHLYRGWQQLRAMYRVARLAEQSLDRRDRGFSAALGQPQQRETRLWFVTERDRLVVRRVRPG